jgi:hypothetical protein
MNKKFGFSPNSGLRKMSRLKDVLSILSHRPLKQKTIKELEEIFRLKTARRGDLSELIWELKFRRTTRARQLYRRALKIHTVQSRPS